MLHRAGLGKSGALDACVSRRASARRGAGSPRIARKRQLAAEGARDGIRVNCVSPGMNRIPRHPRRPAAALTLSRMREQLRVATAVMDTENASGLRHSARVAVVLLTASGLDSLLASLAVDHLVLAPRWLRSERQRASRNHWIRVSTSSTGGVVAVVLLTASGFDSLLASLAVDHLVLAPRWLRSERQRASRNHWIRVSTSSTGGVVAVVLLTASGFDSLLASLAVDHLVLAPRWLRSERQRASRNHWIRVSTSSTGGGLWPSYSSRHLVSTLCSLRSLSTTSCSPLGG